MIIVVASGAEHCLEHIYNWDCRWRHVIIFIDEYLETRHFKQWFCVQIQRQHWAMLRGQSHDLRQRRWRSYHQSTSTTMSTTGDWRQVQQPSWTERVEQSTIAFCSVSLFDLGSQPLDLWCFTWSVDLYMIDVFYTKLFTSLEFLVFSLGFVIKCLQTVIGKQFLAIFCSSMVTEC